jgi:hypothetical protein
MGPEHFLDKSVFGDLTFDWWSAAATSRVNSHDQHIR